MGIVEFIALGEAEKKFALEEIHILVIRKHSHNADKAKILLSEIDDNRMMVLYESKPIGIARLVIAEEDSDYSFMIKMKGIKYKSVMGL